MGKAKQKILIYSPYFSTFGGGERYLFQIAQLLQKENQVYLIADKIIRKKALSCFAINLRSVEFLDPAMFRSLNFFSRFFFIRQFDICFHMTNGSLFYPASKKNYLIIQSHAHIPLAGPSRALKINGWKIICYSSFMEKIIRERINRQAIVLPPAVDLDLFKKDKTTKEKIILSVGRFFSSPLHEKRQDFLLNFFIKNYEKYFQGWRLILCGNLTEPSGKKVLFKMKKKINNFPVELKINLPFPALLSLYQRSSVYWHAAGYGSDAIQKPEKMEHFGITTLEALAAGNVPLVFAAGGQTDIINNNVNGFLWNSEKDFRELNLQLLKNSSLMEKISKNAITSAADYSLNKFNKRLHDLI